jgi:hypothetical protein
MAHDRGPQGGACLIAGHPNKQLSDRGGPTTTASHVPNYGIYGVMGGRLYCLSMFLLSCVVLSYRLMSLID